MDNAIHIRIEINKRMQPPEEKCPCGCSGRGVPSCASVIGIELDAGVSHTEMATAFAKMLHTATSTYEKALEYLPPVRRALVMRDVAMLLELMSKGVGSGPSILFDGESASTRMPSAFPKPGGANGG